MYVTLELVLLCDKIQCIVWTGKSVSAAGTAKITSSVIVGRMSSGVLPGFLRDAIEDQGICSGMCNGWHNQAYRQPAHA